MADDYLIGANPQPGPSLVPPRQRPERPKIDAAVQYLGPRIDSPLRTEERSSGTEAGGEPMRGMAVDSRPGALKIPAPQPARRGILPGRVGVAMSNSHGHIQAACQAEQKSAEIVNVAMDGVEGPKFS
jgi:hypothetical protein